MESAGSGATWTGSPKGVFAGRKHHKPRQGVVASTLNLFRKGAVGFIDWLDLVGQPHHNASCVMPMTCHALDDVWSGKVLSWLAIAQVHCVAVDDVDVCEVLTASLREVGAHRSNGGLDLWNRQHAHVTRNWRSTDCQSRTSACGEQKHARAYAQLCRVHFGSNETELSHRSGTEAALQLKIH